MSSPDPIAPDRLEELLGGALPEGEREALVQGLVRELRAGQAPAPEAVRERVRALGGERPRRRAPRLGLALAAGLVLLAVAALGAGLALRDGARAPAALEQPDAREASELRDAPAAAESESGGEQPFSREDAVRPTSGDLLDQTASDLAAPLPAPGRATDVDLLIELRLAGADELSAAAAEAMTITRDLGGHVAGSNVETDEGEGEAEIALRVPVGRVEDALARLSELGVVTAQRVETQDLQAGIDRRSSRIERLERDIRIAELRLESEMLTEEQRLRLEIRLERQRSTLAGLQRANAADRREAATAELTLLLHTREASPAVEEEDEGGVVGAARDALRLLAAAGVVALFAAIVVSPFVLLLAVAGLAFRSRRRRTEARLLDRAEPATPPRP
ncbi:MAG TPA: DUF4349 domain-containing protein [Gaiellaceae bacterium]|nr:DUF4349 domain-containing protein [Gaiellaceae bacterium]